MVRGDEFTATELQELPQHPLLSPMLKNLVMIGEGISGYPVHDGKGLENHEGKIEALKAAEKLRIAHPHDLLSRLQNGIAGKRIVLRGSVFSRLNRCSASIIR